MRQGLVRLRGRFALMAVVAGSLTLAANTARAASCCNGNPPPLSQTQITNLESNLNALLTENPTGGGQLVAGIRDLLLSDSNSLSAILGLLPAANADQKGAIASGLAQAARLWVGTDAAFATTIQQDVANTKDAPFILAYTNAAGNQPIGAAGGGGGSAGGPGGQTNALSSGFFGTGSAEGIGGNGVNTGPFTMTGGTTGAGTSTTTTTSTVSP